MVDCAAPRFALAVALTLVATGYVLLHSRAA